jgi:hypothetical protein
MRILLAALVLIFGVSAAMADGGGTNGGGNQTCSGDKC